MIPASTAFHEAIKAGAKQRTLLYFSAQDRWFTQFDISMSGQTYEPMFNSEEDLAVGLTPSAQIALSLFNSNGSLDDFDFGWFWAYRGVNTERFSYQQHGCNAATDYMGIRVTGYSETPYLRIGNDAFPNAQPSFPVKSLISIDDVLYCFGDNGKVFVITNSNPTAWSQLASQTWSSQQAHVWSDYAGTFQTETRDVPVAVWKQIQRFIDTGCSFAMVHGIPGNENGLKTTQYQLGKGLEFQYIPVGYFYAERPARVRTDIVAIEGHDAMYVSLNRMADDLEINYPITIQNFLAAVCTKTGLVCKTAVLPNGEKVVTEADLDEQLVNHTYRELMGFIAEAAGCNAVIDYDGKLAFKRFTAVNILLTEHDYGQFVPMEYTVHAVSRLQIRNSESEVMAIVGTGTNDYIIQDNPLLIFDDETAGNACALLIYNALRAVPEYIPSTIQTWFADFTIQPGDIIQVQHKGTTYHVPLFALNHSWSGLTTATAECTGNEFREPVEMTKRANFELKQDLTKVKKELDGYTSSQVFINAVQSLTTAILGSNGGSVRFLDTNGDGEPDTLYIADNPDPLQAVKVWRFNYEGWGASTHGYNGPFTLGASLASGIVADFITAGTLNAALIKTGLLQDYAQKNYWNMQTGEFRIGANTLVGSGTDTISSLLQGLQEQIDGQIETFYYDYVPTLSNAPASSWTTDAEKNNHVGDLFYQKSTGYCYRFLLDGSTYKWVRISDEDISTALANAVAAQDTADHKRRVFVSTPTVPYDVGDLWFDSSSSDIMTCMTAKTASQTYSVSDWVKRNKYTDDSAFTAFRDGTYATFVTNTTNAINGKITTYYQNDAPGTHNTGDLWIDTDDGNKLYRWNGSAWISVQDSGIQSALTAAATAQTTADGKIVTFAQASTPTATDVGDLWIDTDDNNKLYRWNGEQWVVMTDSSSLVSWINNTYNSDKSSMQTQIDGKAETWYQSSDPSSGWTTIELKDKHLGDLWYKTTDQTTWYYQKNGSTYSWVQQNVPTAVFDKIDGKAQIFTSQPVPPYNVGDLWTQGSEGDIFRCKTAKTASGSFSASDWELASKYTDDSLASEISGKVTVNQSEIQKLNSEITSKVSQTTYEQGLAGKADSSYVATTVQSLQQQTATDIQNIFIQSKQYTNDSLTDYEKLKEDVYAWQKFSADGLEIGKSNSPFKTVLSNEKLAFTENGAEVAYIGNSSMNITNARITNILSVGTETDGWFDWITTGDGMAMKWKD